MDYKGGDYIYTALSSNSDVTDIVGASIYNARMIPQTDTSTETINFYQAGTLNLADEYFQLTWSIDCRAATGYKSQELAGIVGDALNRIHYDLGGVMYFGTCSILGMIPPADEADVYNTPIQIILRRR
jgi:hypothetical protein